MNGVRFSRGRSGQYSWYGQVAFGDWGGTDANRAVGRDDMRRAGVDLRIDRDALDA